MVLGEGDYCPEVEHTCLKEWYDEQNKKQVCETFAKEDKCTGTKVKKRYCIDKYEWPNQKGERPEVMNRFHQAQVKCASVGKRLCTESDWMFACEGPNMTPFPYGYVRDATKCNGDHPWDGPNMKKVAARDPGELARLWKGVRSGSQPDCVSAFGVYDLNGNVNEWVVRPGEKPPNRSGLKGGWWGPVRGRCRPTVGFHKEEDYGYEEGFRCCADAGVWGGERR
jgi:formylglycine-generating enzyme required for sulfatase activity